MTSKNRRRRYIRWRMGGIMRENRKVVQTGEDSVNFYRCSWFLTFDRPFLKRLYNHRCAAVWLRLVSMGPVLVPASQCPVAPPESLGVCLANLHILRRKPPCPNL